MRITSIPYFNHLKLKCSLELLFVYIFISGLSMLKNISSMYKYTRELPLYDLVNKQLTSSCIFEWTKLDNDHYLKYSNAIAITHGYQQFTPIFCCCFVSLHFGIWNTVIWLFLDKLGKSGLISCETRIDRHYFGRFFISFTTRTTVDDQTFFGNFREISQEFSCCFEFKNWAKINNCLENAPGSSE